MIFMTRSCSVAAAGKVPLQVQLFHAEYAVGVEARLTAIGNAKRRQLLQPQLQGDAQLAARQVRTDTTVHP